MKLWYDNGLIPGTVLKKAEKGNLTGMAFLDNIYFVSSGVMLTQIREISGIDGSTLQNWVKRGWVNNTVNKKYSKDQLARILIINMLRSCMLLERVDRLLHYINGDIEDTLDDIIPESRLYDYICTIYDRYMDEECESEEELDRIISETTVGYTEPVAGAGQRLMASLKIILVAYLASIAGSKANELFVELP